MLLVDDNAEMRRAIREQISKQEGMKVVGECANGLEALEFLGKTAVDAMVLDIIMPQMDGYALMEDGTKEIRYETNTADGATWNLTYYVSKADAVTAIDMLYEP